jgi:prepilin-type N-terminal cleavage/methylation domain-containing protein
MTLIQINVERGMPTQSRGHDTRRGFTLVELMITMAIIVILSALVAVAMGGAQESARVSHTRAVIARLHTLIMDRYESYRSRRLPIQSTSVSGNDSPLVAAMARCKAVRELMRMELPDRWTDIDMNDPPVVLKSPTTAYLAYQNAYKAALTQNAAAGQNTLDPTYQGADCLYWIVTMGLEENDVLENFSQSDIGPDPKNSNSGLLCFLDSWGNPIQFLRWAPGFTSPMQPNIPTDPDQTDPTGVYGTPSGSTSGGTLSYALYPLIYSAGPDGYYDIQTNIAIPYSRTNPPNSPFASLNSVYQANNVPVGGYLADAGNTTGSPGYNDNIHNQEIGAH